MRYNNINIYAHLNVVSTVLAMVYVRHASHLQANGTEWRAFCVQ